LRDLLLDESVPYNERPQVSIREDIKGRILLTGLKQVPINSVEDLLNALNFGSSIRQTDATAVNARSSRSHAVFSLNLVQKKGQVLTSTKDKRRSVPLEAFSGSENWITVDSKLHFVDLAGSERLKNTNAHGERAKEGISINAGLASLGKVISQLSSRQPGSHVSYRDSRLTRLLQDSLGGNAITYMIACVNPAEFHLSETLNTVQYAQRARAIQSKPQIQQVHDDSDKQAVIERLRAEVSFLRDQIRLSERSERRPNAPQDRSERLQEREMELQNQILDVQENYNALSQRHAKLISEIAKARDSDSSEMPLLKETLGNSAIDRLNRSNSFAEAVESMVIEYEKTIQTLEASLSNTRSSLSNTESSLLEKETRIAFMESMTVQLQARLAKAVDRGKNDENYLRDLESRVAGATTDEEKASTLVQSLRKELTRVRETEAGAEDYISTLEERLAEAEQQHEMMSREIERLEHVVERQRSINKLDNLLYELDHIRESPNKSARTEPPTNGHSHSHKTSESFHSLSATDAEHMDDTDSVIVEHPDEHEAENRGIKETEGGAVKEHRAEESRNLHPINIVQDRSLRPEGAEDDEPTSPAQSKFVNDKLETVTQELFDLKVEHEVTITEYDSLQRKYQVALTTLAELQDAVEDARRGNYSRPTSFIATKSEGSPQKSLNLSTELSSAGDAPSVTDPAEASEAKVETREVEEKVPMSAISALSTQREEELAVEIEGLRKLDAEKEAHMAELTEHYTQLQEKHQDTLEYVEELKSEMQKAASTTGRASPTPNIFRRKAERSSILSDRANRSFAAMRNMVMETFEDEPEKAQSFENNINTAMTEFHMRSERVLQLESELGAVKREMESKMAIITGLTRERSSLKASPIDMSAIGKMQEQLMESEHQIRSLSETHASREKELLEQIDHLQQSLSTRTSATSATSVGSVRQSSDSSINRGSMSSEDHQQRQVVQLQKEVADWRSKHNSTMESMKASEKQLLATITDLETNLRSAESTASRAVSPEETQTVEEERKRYEVTIAGLQKEVDEHKVAAAHTASRLTELEQSYQKITSQVDEDARSKELTEKELSTHRDLVANLESQLEAHKASIASHQEGLESLKVSHSKEVDEIKGDALRIQTESNEKLEATLNEHKQSIATLQEDLEKARASTNESQTSFNEAVAKSKEEIANLMADAAMILGKPTNSRNITAHIQALVNARKDIGALHETATNELQTVRQELETIKASSAESSKRLEEMKLLNEETMKELERISEKERKSSGLVEELEEQLNSNFDQAQVANNRLSALQTERQVHMEEIVQAKADIEKELEDARHRISQLEVSCQQSTRCITKDKSDSMPQSQYNRRSNEPQQDVQRSNSGNGNPRKSIPAANLPSPPPAIPLPPLPAGSGSSSGPSPPTSRHASKDIATSQLVEDQEARIRTIEKHLFAEKQLTATLEEALTDLESSSTKMKTEMEAWRRKCSAMEDELQSMRKDKQNTRLSVQQMEDDARKRIELERQKLETRMQQLQEMSRGKNKKKSSINCF
jgi:chromosome segregation ATPase